MSKTILLTGGTDGIGFETAKKLVLRGHTILLHGRNPQKLEDTKALLMRLNKSAQIRTYRADFSKMTEVEQLIRSITSDYQSIDVLINNAGVFKTSATINDANLDVRFIVNTIAPYALTKGLLSLFDNTSRVINLSSAAQSSVDLAALQGKKVMSDNNAYAQSKLAITMWTFQLAALLGETGPSLIAVNPASFLGSKMVKEAYGSDGKDLTIGADILVNAALNDEFAHVKGRYFDNDIGTWAQPHTDALDNSKNEELVNTIEAIIKQLKQPSH
ncbi:SDR family NAD(P)-dependent oxidoreductase [Glaciecola petra]|uniref:SDR family NAD(P)-dependent oxidoreductase n=1 Tax=Glaciecola petra TaxID=3075602 RepID=A0ABU2ZPQ9_9ALTE|nr:SDR family NAD(P)-dependent oxidoreductase [Aestuariibacter sp. P117]MDT0594618.1 SDR family NAD(P)-dependent oxidoreductase [Aestuariibacter sp. P117]